MIDDSSEATLLMGIIEWRTCRIRLLIVQNRSTAALKSLFE